MDMIDWVKAFNQFRRPTQNDEQFDQMANESNREDETASKDQWPLFEQVQEELACHMPFSK